MLNEYSCIWRCRDPRSCMEGRCAAPVCKGKGCPMDTNAYKCSTNVCIYRHKQRHTLNFFFWEKYAKVCEYVFFAFWEAVLLMIFICYVCISVPVSVSVSVSVSVWHIICTRVKRARDMQCSPYRYTYRDIQFYTEIHIKTYILWSL